MRLRLFTLLLVPSLALMVLGYFTFADRQTVVDDADAALTSAAVAVQLADLDRALGAEALASTSFIEGQTSWSALVIGQFSKTDVEIARILSQSDGRTYGPEIAGALEDVSVTLTFRSDIRDGYISPLQVVDRYSHMRRILLDALAAEVGSLSRYNSVPDLLVLTALTEARSAHLNERIALDLAITYDTWAPGQHSAAVSAIANHDSHLQFVNNNGAGKLGEIAVTDSLAEIREMVHLSEEPPRVSVEYWNSVSDEWSAILEQEIEGSVAQTTDVLLEAERSAANSRRVTLVLVATTLFVAFMVALLVAMRIVKRVQAITSKAALLATGDISAESLACSVVGGKDEIADLADAFDNMALEISIREDALAIESAVLEGIASGEEIEPTLRTLEWLLGSRDGRCDYRFTTLPAQDDSVPINDVSGEYTSLYIEPVAGALPIVAPYSSQARSAMSLASLAQRRADDNAMLHQRATRDHLTGLLNRRAILDDAAKWMNWAVQRDERFPAIIYADLDGFKEINDTHGHAIGDSVLVESSRRMADAISDVGGNAGRFGGDEFLVIAAEVDNNERLLEICQELIRQLGKPIEINGEQITIGVSIGAVLCRAETPIEGLISDADLALYAAKAAGRGQTVISDEEFRESAVEKAELTDSVIAALYNEEFIPWFQPIWSDDGTKIAAFEALVRWTSPSGRTLSPFRFLPILEQQNLIGALDALIFKKVCLMLAEWADLGRALVPMHLNVSPSRIENPNFVKETKEMLATTGVAPELIIVEVTESDLMTDISKNGRRLQELRDIGVLIAADDFGTGYSSLSYLRDLPVDILKIDRQFISEIDKSPTNIKIVSAVIRLARDLGLSVVAEGVERQEELDVLNENECHYIQGYLLGKPIPQKETESLIGRHSALLSSELAERNPSTTSDSDHAALDRHFDALREHLAVMEVRTGGKS